MAKYQRNDVFRWLRCPSILHASVRSRGCREGGYATHLFPRRTYIIVVFGHNIRRCSSILWCSRVEMLLPDHILWTFCWKSSKDLRSNTIYWQLSKLLMQHSGDLHWAADALLLVRLVKKRNCTGLLLIRLPQVVAFSKNACEWCAKCV